MAIEAFSRSLNVTAADFSGKATAVAYVNSTKTLFVGTSDGYVCQFEVREEEKVDGSNGAAAQAQNAFFRSKQRCSKKPVTQLDVLEDRGFLIVSCDGTITVHNLTTLNRDASKLPTVKNATCFCTDKNVSSGR